MARDLQLPPPADHRRHRARGARSEEGDRARRRAARHDPGRRAVRRHRALLRRASRPAAQRLARSTAPGWSRLVCLCLIPAAREVDAIVALALAAGVTSAVIAFEDDPLRGRSPGAPGPGGRCAGGAASAGPSASRTTGVQIGGQAGRRRPARDRGGSRAGSRARRSRRRAATRPCRGAESRASNTSDGADPRRAGSGRPRAPAGSRSPSQRSWWERDLLRQLHSARSASRTGCSRRSVWVFIVAHSGGVELAGFSRMSSVMPTLPTSCRALAWRSSSACSAVMPTSARAARRGGPSARCARRSRRRATPRPRRAGGRSRAPPRRGRRALAHALEQLVVARDAVPTRRSANSLQAIAPNAPISRATSGAATSMIVPRSKRNRACEESGTGQDRHRAHDPEREAPARERRQHREQGEQQHDVHADRERSGSPQRGPDRVRLDLGAGHQLLAADGRRVHVAERGRGRPHHHDLAVGSCLGHAVVDDVRERHRRDRAGRAAVVDPCLAVAEAARVGRVAGEALRSAFTAMLSSRPAR